MNSQKLSAILVPLDGSDAADRAIPVAARIAARSGARLHLAAVCRPLETENQALRRPNH